MAGLVAGFGHFFDSIGMGECQKSVKALLGKMGGCGQFLGGGYGRGGNKICTAAEVDVEVVKEMLNLLVPWQEFPAVGSLV